MAMSFHVGQKVVRVGSTGKTYETELAKYFKFSYPEIGEVVTVRTINVWSSWTALTFCEHDNSHLVGVASKIEPGFASHHFRPIVEPKAETSFTEGAPKDSEAWDNRVKKREKA